MNKVAIITGGARRIGAETANYLHSKNVDIIITYSKSSIAAKELKKNLNLKESNLVKFIKLSSTKMQIIEKCLVIFLRCLDD
jgi:pteridine reductase